MNLFKLLFLLVLALNLNTAFTQNQLIYFDVDDSIEPPLNAIYQFDSLEFDFDKASIRPKSKTELDRAVDFLNRFPFLKVEFRGYTDERGNDEYNLKLSEYRMRSVYSYFKSMGISQERMAYKGFGETTPYTVRAKDTIGYNYLNIGEEMSPAFLDKKYKIWDKDRIENCHQMNRRGEMVIVGKFPDTTAVLPADPVVIEGIVFQFDKDIIQAQSFPILDKFVQYLNDNPTIVVEIRVHLGVRGNWEQYSHLLSQSRAESIVDYLVEKGIEMSRLAPKGYEGTQPYTYEGNVLTKEYIETINDEDRREMLYQMNRRVEFFILAKDYAPKSPKKTLEAPFLLNE